MVQNENKDGSPAFWQIADGSSITMTPAEARNNLHVCEQDRLDMSKPDEHIDRLLRIEAAKERARKCLEESARSGG
jgi:hypothetical protein